MANETFSFSMNLSPGQPAGGRPARYISLPFEAHPIHDGQVLLMVAGRAETRRLPLQLAQLLSCCDGLRSLEEHARQAAARMRLPTHQVAALKQPLQELVDRELLIDEARLWEVLQADEEVEEDHGRIETLFVRTCARPDTLRRLLESLGRQAAASGLERCVILDDSKEGPDRQATREVVESVRPRLDVDLQLIDRDRRAALLDAIAGDAGCDPATLQWFLEGEADEETLTYGAGPNLALLLAAGTRFALMDDDATLDAWTLEEAADRPFFFSEPNDRLRLPASDTELPGPGFKPLSEHPLAHHARYLGRRVGALLAAGSSGASDALDGLTPNLLHRLATQPRAKITSSSVCGDPGTEDLHWIYAQKAQDLRPLCTSEEDYRRRVFQRRVVRCPMRAVATPNFALMTTTLTGVDNRELLLPTAARERNEDMLYGALITYLYPDALQVTVPHALYHMRPQPRSWTLEDLDRPRVPNRGRFLSAWVEELGAQCRSTDTDTRLDCLVAGLKDLARQERASVEAAIGRLMTELRARLIERIETTLGELSPPDWMTADFRRAIESSASIPAGETEDLRRIAESAQRFASAYADRLPDWCLAWRHCRDTGIARLLETTG